MSKALSLILVALSLTAVSLAKEQEKASEKLSKAYITVAKNGDFTLWDEKGAVMEISGQTGKIGYFNPGERLYQWEVDDRVSRALRIIGAQGHG